MFSFFKKKKPNPVAVSETMASPSDASLGSPAAGLIGSALVSPIATNSPAPAQGLQPGREPWLNKLKAGLRKTGSSISSVFTGTQIDEALYEDLEEALLMAQRVHIMAPHPGRIVRTVEAELDRSDLGALRVDRRFLEVREDLARCLRGLSQEAVTPLPPV